MTSWLALALAASVAVAMDAPHNPELMDARLDLLDVGRLELMLDVGYAGALSCAQMRCMASAAVGSVGAIVPRLWNANGTVDPAFMETYSNWADAGCDSGLALQYALAFPCAGGTQDAVRQAYNSSAAAQDARLFGVFLAVLPNHETGCGWSRDDHWRNCNFVQNWVTVSPLLVSGIYTTRSAWTEIMGDECSYIAEATPDIWYLDGDHVPSFHDWVPFGAWNTSDSTDLVFAKRYSSNASVCNSTTNLNVQLPSHNDSNVNSTLP